MFKNKLISDLKSLFYKGTDMLANKLGMAGFPGVRIKYGHEYGTSTVVDGCNMQASITLAAASSYFMTSDASGNLALTGAADTFVVGHLIAPVSNTGSSTAGADVFSLNVANDAAFRVPISSGTYSRANRFKLCDLVVSANVQGAAVQVSTRGHLQLLDGDEANNKWVIVRINPAKQSAGNAA